MSNQLSHTFDLIYTNLPLTLMYLTAYKLVDYLFSSLSMNLPLTSQVSMYLALYILLIFVNIFIYLIFGSTTPGLAK